MATDTEALYEQIMRPRVAVLDLADDIDLLGNYVDELSELHFLLARLVKQQHDALRKEMRALDAKSRRKRPYASCGWTRPLAVYFDLDMNFSLMDKCRAFRDQIVVRVSAH